MRVRLICILLASTVLACHTSKKPSVKAVSSSINHSWILEKLNGYPLETDSFDREKPMIEIRDQMYFGYGGCNRLSGKLTLSATTIRFNPGPITRKACIEGNIEPAFVQALLSSTTYKIEHNKLELKNAAGQQVCLFGLTSKP